MGYLKEALVKNVMNVMNNNCTLDKITPTKYRTGGNLFLGRPDLGSLDFES